MNHEHDDDPPWNPSPRARALIRAGREAPPMTEEEEDRAVERALRAVAAARQKALDDGAASGSRPRPPAEALADGAAVDVARPEPRSAAEATRRWWKRGALIAAALVACAVAAVALSLSVLPAQRAPRASSIARQRSPDAEAPDAGPAPHR